MGIIRELEQHALAVRDDTPRTPIMSLDEPSPRVELIMDRPLFTPPVKPYITQQSLDEGHSDVDADALFEQFYVDKERLRARLRRAMQTCRQVSLAELLEAHPLEHGLAGLVAWLSLATGEGRGVIDDSRLQTVDWIDSTGCARRATLPTVVFVRDGQHPD
jgi:hypothetical protein